ncbi:peptidylprolyl isomerase [Tunicatimonas pelagia]|uniref:peptidylprolyl isomerase n=1 Tax=Tunicatimonas pelagia TaxID=931531 RepID=UPI002665BF52|nr:peptidylprolyl isomerase [Tunicatimonas pelagia]WKN46275.1 peptidylprolyl isomerase [Tunicatimonas pelagia]
MRIIIASLIFLLTAVNTFAQTTNSLPKSEKKALKQAKKLRKRLLKGADFNQLARKYSDDPGSGSVGGEMGRVQFGQFVPEYDSTVLALEVGKISEPFRTKFGYHLIELLGRNETTFTSRHILIKP